jgi:hypothetical protein
MLASIEDPEAAELVKALGNLLDERRRAELKEDLARGEEVHVP